MTARIPGATAALAAAVVTTLAALGTGGPAGAVTPTPAPTSSSVSPNATATTTPAPSATPTPASTPPATASVAAPAALSAAAPPATDPPTPSLPPTPSPTPVVPLPVAVSMNKHVGHTAASRTVTLIGQQFTNLAGVQFAGNPVTDLVVLSDTRARFVLGNSYDYQAKIAAVTLTAISDPTPRPTALTYQYKVDSPLDRQMAYAFQNWNASANPTFGYLSGSDCANFASQTLLARGWRRSSQWYDYGAGRWSATWVSSTALSSWLKRRTDLATHLGYSQRDQVVVGDLVQFRWPGHSKKYSFWDHTAVVSKVVVLPNGRHDIYYVAHTLNRQYGGGTTGLAAWYAGRKIPGSTLRIQFFHLKR